MLNCWVSAFPLKLNAAHHSFDFPTFHPSCAGVCLFRRAALGGAADVLSSCSEPVISLTHAENTPLSLSLPLSHLDAIRNTQTRSRSRVCEHLRAERITCF